MCIRDRTWRETRTRPNAYLLPDKFIVSLKWWNLITLKSKIIKVAYPTLINVLKVKDDNIDLIKRSNLNYDELVKIDINQDLEKSQKFFVSILKIAQEIDFNHISVEDILTNENIKLNISNALNEGFNLEISEKGLSKILICYLDDLLKENNFEHLIGLIDSHYLKNDLANDFLTLVDIYKTLDENEILAYFSGENPNLSITDELRTKLDNVIEQLFGLKLLENQEKKLVQTAFMFTDYDQEKISEMLNENIDWHQEVDSVAKMARSNEILRIPLPPCIVPFFRLVVCT